MNFYCKKACGDPDFSIAEWNRKYNLAVDMGLSEVEKDKLLDDRQFGLQILCEEQCFDCMAIVGERRNKTKSL